ncbi:hypothetical protein OIU74_016054 [Salix koriyanagi]|uniref:Uncharacterized protein n=1 Tax=Salix koriyanagi TaxID=2511006 RepID=A0A9Q0PFK7_9ROSI|nr:hypothetical protein OIU74_016054 [Salix koriyanagi]
MVSGKEHEARQRLSSPCRKPLPAVVNQEPAQKYKIEVENDSRPPLSKTLPANNRELLYHYQENNIWIDGVSAIVIDLDSHTCKAGYAGEDAPKAVFPSDLRLEGFVGTIWRCYHLLKDGIVADWDMVDRIWNHAFKECLLIDPKEHPMLLAEPSSNSQQQRERIEEAQKTKQIFG